MVETGNYQHMSVSTGQGWGGEQHSEDDWDIAMTNKPQKISNCTNNLNKVSTCTKS